MYTCSGPRQIAALNTESRGAIQNHEYQLYLKIEDVDHSRTKARNTLGFEIVPTKKEEQPSKREYPALYEKFVPIALVAIGLAVTILVIIIIIIALGLLPGSGY